MSAQILRTGCLVSLVQSDERGLRVQPEFFAELSEGPRVTTSLERHGGRVIAWQRDNNLQFDDPTAAEVEAAVRDAAGLLSWHEYRAQWPSSWAFVARGGLAKARDRRKHRWMSLIRALSEARVPASRSRLDAVPFELHLDERLRARLR